MNEDRQVVAHIRDMESRRCALLTYAKRFDEFAECEQLLRGKPLEKVAHDLAAMTKRAWSNEENDPEPPQTPYLYDPHDR